MTINVIDKEVIEYPQDNEVVLSVNGISKKFCRDLRLSLLYGVQDIASELVGVRNKSDRLRTKEFWALKDVSFQLRKGESLGLVGANGAGKTTLLRIISGLIRPDDGSVEVKGRVAPLIALGAGFNPILTGRENIYTNMSILGLSKQEIEERFDSVLDFAEIGSAIDAPVQSYSSGMAARLGFASAIHTEPEVLLVDEVLAVGDSRFRGKCLQKLHELRQKGTAFILVSHNSHLILTICNSAVYLMKGKFGGSGDTASIVSQYEEDLFLNKAKKSSGSITLPEKSASQSYGFDIVSMFFKNAQEELIESPISGEPAYFCIKCKAKEKVDDVGFSFVVKGLAEGGEVVVLLNSLSDEQPMSFLPGEHEVQIQMPYLGLRVGVYTIDIFIKRSGFYHLDSYESFQIIVKGKESASRGLFYQPRTWKVVSG